MSLINLKLENYFNYFSVNVTHSMGKISRNLEALSRGGAQGELIKGILTRGDVELLLG